MHRIRDVPPSSIEATGFPCKACSGEVLGPQTIKTGISMATASNVTHRCCHHRIHVNKIC